MSAARNLSWIYASKSNEELKRRYAEWAEEYDLTLEEWGWLGPSFTAELFAKYVPRSARVLDAGAGTGLVGQRLAELGYADVSALDLSLGMMEVARGKNAYVAFHEMTLGEPLAFESASFDAVIAVGVFTLGHAPANSLEELARIIRPGGHLAFLAREDVYEEHGFRDTLETLAGAGRVALAEVSGPRVTLPNEPDAAAQRVYVYKVLQ